jgi:hypothetical protein
MNGEAYDLTVLARRDVRRAFGPDVVALIHQQHAQIQALTRMVNAQTVQIDRLIGVTATDGARITTHAHALHAFLDRPLLQRLRWLFGR